MIQRRLTIPTSEIGNHFLLINYYDYSKLFGDEVIDPDKRIEYIVLSTKTFQQYKVVVEGQNIFVPESEEDYLVEVVFDNLIFEFVESDELDKCQIYGRADSVLAFGEIFLVKNNWLTIIFVI